MLKKRNPKIPPIFEADRYFLNLLKIIGALVVVVAISILFLDICDKDKLDFPVFIITLIMLGIFQIGLMVFVFRISLTILQVENSRIMAENSENQREFKQLR